MGSVRSFEQTNAGLVDVGGRPLMMSDAAAVWYRGYLVRGGWKNADGLAVVDLIEALLAEIQLGVASTYDEYDASAYPAPKLTQATNAR